ncbi:MAG: PBP1A family penicillin-binding protein [Desulfobacterales bacterium]|nr:PBP1A family penicillin-binding protein [Desulfobacterales bacterium]
MINFLKNHKILIFIVFMAAPFSGILTGFFYTFTSDLPEIRELNSFKPSEVTKVYTSDNQLLTEFYIERRRQVSITDIPAHLKNAIVMTEDRNFYSHIGVDIKGIFRAIVKDIIAGEFVEGASTITQQLAKTLFFTSKKTIVRKIKEAIVALQIERRYTKDEILALYLNQIYLGSGAYGVDSASKTYFGKTVTDCDLSESAMLAALPRSPSRYSPLNNLKLAVKRRNIVLKVLLKTNKINRVTYDKAIKTKLKLSETNKKQIAQHFVEFIRNKMEKELGPSILYKGGLSIYTTINMGFQKEAENSALKHMKRLKIRMKRNGISKPDPECALIALNNKNGAIISMIGGLNYMKSAFNRATIAKRQPGSAFKPIVYAYAIEQGFSQNNILLDSPIVFKTGSKIWRPENFSKTFLGEITMRKALALSKNIPAIRLIDKLGTNSVSAFGNKLGIKNTLRQNLSLALGTSEVTLINLTSTYSVFSNMGQKNTPFPIEKVIDKNGKIIFRKRVIKEIVMSRSGAAIISNMLEGVVKEGTAKKASFLSRPVAGKTGTTDNYIDALFVGFSPETTVGVWVGNDNNTTLGKGETGARAALPIWIDYMNKTFENQSINYFDIPDNTKNVHIDPDTGKRDESERSVSALFKKGKEPSL